MARRGVKERIRISRVGLWKNKGFTLIELALVVLLISIPLLLIAPLLSHFISSYQRDFALQRIEAFLNYHQGEIERSGEERIFCLDFEQGEYWAELRGKENFVEIKEVLGKRATLPKTLSFVDLVTSKGKFNEGIGNFSLSPSTLEPVIIHLEDKKGKYYSLCWKPLSGKIEIYDEYIEEGVYASGSTG